MVRIMDNPCLNCEINISIEDIKVVEKELGYSFSSAFVSHYLSYNGGMPLRSWWENNDDFEPYEIAVFKSFKYHKVSDNGSKSLIDGCYNEMTNKNVIPENLIPFANDWGGNFFCLDKNDNGIVFYAIDSFDPDLSLIDNHRVLQKKISPSFEDFMSNLVEEGDLE